MSTPAAPRPEASRSPAGAAGGLTSYGDVGFSRFLRGVFLAGAGHDESAFDRPMIGIADLRSDYNPCHRDVPAILEHVKRGVLEAGGTPMVFPTMSLGETLPHAYLDALPQPDGDGDRGADPVLADGCRGAARRVRQDGAGPADGRCLERTSRWSSR